MQNLESLVISQNLHFSLLEIREEMKKKPLIRQSRAPFQNSAGEIIRRFPLKFGQVEHSPRSYALRLLYSFDTCMDS